VSVTLALFSATVSLLLSFVIASEAGKLGFAVALRFLERGRHIPPGNQPLTAANLEIWRSAPDNHASARGYASRIMLYDIAFLLSLGCFFGFGSTALAGPIAAFHFDSVGLWILPALYIASDFIKDMLIRNVLLSPAPPANNFVLMRWATAAKLASSSACFVQILALAIWSMLH